ncbi:amino acid adenylation domain-containing protein [Microbulbifer sp. 2201CG32-9]|uniref:amino acid adenylation domain-containing protein n=1 Tax=Microbulbifer sp. 2201CG32-9 TaxID=3232309 RepID=UPI00345C45F4
MGRVDHQVNIRGFRVEPAEIEAQLRLHPRILQAVVITQNPDGLDQISHRQGSKEAHLMAYLVTDSTEEEALQVRQSIEAHLRTQLPEYMRPSAMLFIDSLPLTPSGKLDRQALPALTESPQAQLAMAPEGPVEVLLADLWRQVLSCDTVARDDNFFDLGGNSLLATRLLSRIQNAFDRQLSIREVFECQCLREQAVLIMRSRTLREGIPPLVASDDGLPKPLSFAQERMWFLHEYIGPHPVYNLLLALDIRGDVDAGILARSVLSVIERQPSLRTRFIRDQGEIRQVIEPSKSHLDIEEAGGENDLYQAYASERDRPFDLSTDVLARVRLLHLRDGDRYLLLLSMHHAVGDAWSSEIFYRELAALYRAFTAGEASPLSKLPLQYSDFARWQRQSLRGEMLQDALDYWSQQLSGLPPCLNLPTDRPRPEKQTFRGGNISVSLPSPLLQSLRHLSRREGVTLFMTLMSAFAVLLSRYSGQRDLVIGTPIANRTQAQTEALMGFFVNALALPVRVGANPSFVQLLHQVRETTLSAYDYQYLPFEKLVEALSPQRDARFAPIFQVMFALQNVPLDAPQCEGIEWSSLELPEHLKDRGVAKFDLTLILREGTSEKGKDVLYGEFEYNSDLFDAESVERIFTDYRQLLGELVHKPEAALGNLNYLSPARCQSRYSQLHIDDPLGDAGVFTLNIDRALELLDPDRSRSFCADATIARIQELSCAGGAHIGVCLEDEVLANFTVLAILQRNAVAVLLPPDAPRLRLAHLVQDSGISALVTDSSHLGAFEVDGIPVVCLPAEWEIESASRVSVDPIFVHALQTALLCYPDQGGLAPVGRVLSLTQLAALKKQLALSPPGLNGDLVEMCCASLGLILPDTDADEKAAEQGLAVLDNNGQWVGEGVTGELCLDSRLGMESLWARPRETALALVPNPFSKRPGARLWATGRRALCQANGRCQILVSRTQGYGSGDTLSHNLLQAASLPFPGKWVVVEQAGDESAGQPPIVSCYYSLAESRTDSAPTAGEVKKAIFQQLRALGSCRLPTHWMALEALPLTASGKIDRSALPPIGQQGKSGTPVLEGVVESLLALQWQAVLGREVTDRNDNFFALGGHSLIATQLLSRIRDTFEVTLGIRQLFELQTLRDQAAAIDAARRDGTSPEASTSPQDLPPLAAQPRPEHLPLSYAQQRLWFLSQYMGPNAVYNMPLALRLRGELDTAMLTASLATLWQRHESLRTRFEEREGQLQQVIDDPALSLEVETLSSSDQLLGICREERFYHFDLSRDALCRLRLLHDRQDHSHVLLVTMHHSISDGWSLGVFLRELLALYDACRQGRADTLPPLPLQYADFALWQRQWLRGEVLDRQVDYWRGQLAGLPPLLTLPTDRPRPAAQSYDGRVETLTLPAALSTQLRHLSQSRGVTLFMTLLAAFSVLLSRYAGQKDLAIGTPIANRTQRDTESLIGFFVNTLVMRCDLRDDPSFDTLLRRTRETALAGFAHQDIPFEQLVEKLSPERSLSHSPLFQVMFAMQNVPLDWPSTAGLTVSPLEQAAEAGVSRFDLTLTVEEGSGEGAISGGLEYNTDLFARETMVRLLAHYQALLQAIVAAPEQSVARYEFLTAAEKRLQVETWNHSGAAVPAVGLAQLFEAQVTRTPDAVALVTGDRQLSYVALNDRANALAHCLMGEGVGPEVRVGLCVERSLEMVVGLLGILKAGGAYVPLDPDYPLARLQHIVTDSGLAVVVTSAQTAAVVAGLDGPGDCAPRTLQISAAVSGPSLGNPELPCHPGQAAYVIYTSGSTGQPKGAVLSHVNAVNFLTSMGQRPGLGRRDRLLAVTTLSFDIALLEWMLPLVNGACCDIASTPLTMSGDELSARVQQQAITLLQATPVTWKLMLECGWQGKANLKGLIGGEAFSQALVAELSPKVASLWNMYGPTETCVWSSVAQLEVGAQVTLGRGIGNTEMYVLDAQGQLCPLGVPGELHIGGAGLARAYHGRAALTAERFVPHPYATRPGERLYATGDGVRWQAGGELVYLGRLDQQVKLRGFRIELGEIESLLLAQSAVQDAVAVVRREREDNPQLLAYVVPATGLAEEVLRESLREALRCHLPGYMQPSAIGVLEHFPLTANGKIDRSALPVPDAVAASAGFEAPQGEWEEVLAGLWSELLRCSRVGRGDNFFDLGGHSILAAQLLSRLRQEFAIGLPMRAVFEQQTLRGLAGRVERSVQQRSGAIGAEELNARIQANQSHLDGAVDELEEGEI